jgi:hypothetical protein
MKTGLSACETVRAGFGRDAAGTGETAPGGNEHCVNSERIESSRTLVVGQFAKLSYFLSGKLGGRLPGCFTGS